MDAPDSFTGLYELTPKPRPVCGPGDFPFAAVGLDHGHIGGQCAGLVAAGGELRAVWDADPARLADFVGKFPGARPARSEAEILDDPTIKLVATAAVPSERGPLGLRVMDAGKDFFADKAPFTTLDQLAAARAKLSETGRRHWVYYSERLHTESGVFAGDLLARGAIGRVLQVLGLGPHRLNAPTRPGWFFQKEKTGGILCDIGSHQGEQFLHYTGARDATVLSARVANFHHPEHPEFEDFGEATFVGDNGTSNYYRVDWFTPDGLSTWGDGRTFILGTEGTMELRKYVDVAAEKTGEHLITVNRDGEQHFRLSGKVGYPFFGQLLRDCLDGTETAMTQAHIFKAAELCLRAQAVADGAAFR